MKWFEGYRIRLLLVGFIAAVVLGGGIAKADFTFGTPTNLGPPVNTSANDGGPSISADGLSLYFKSRRPGGYGDWDLWVTTRITKNAEWGTPVHLGSTVNSSAGEKGPSISADGLSLFFYSDRPGGHGSFDIWMTTRATTEDDWGTPVNLGPPVNSSANDRNPDISADDLTLYFVSNRPGGYGDTDFWVTTRTTKNANWGTPVHLGSTVNSSSAERQPTISDDGLWLFFHSNRPGGSGGEDIWVSTRATTDDNWGTSVNLGSTVNSSAHEFHPDISRDGSTLYFGSTRPGGIGGYDLWQVSISPVVDFNVDGIVDSADMCIMVDHWGENYSLCDIGPTPLGDGIVDVQDLIVLAEHLLTYPGAMAYWKLDETEGDIAYDSAADNDAVVFGDAVWQPAGGQIDGALQFDGIDDYVSTPFILDPADGAFSVFTWIKDGGPGQVIISQTGGANWLLADPAEGKLMTELQVTGRSSLPLMSESVITDGHWHRIGFVWDGSYRTLYIDGTEVAKDTQPQAYLEAAYGGLYFGAGKDLDPASFFSGLIDDVRIYDRAITP